MSTVNFSKAVLSQGILSAALSQVSRAVQSRSTLPVLTHILFQGADDKLTLSATNLEIGIIAHIDAKIEGEFSMTLPAKLIGETVNSLVGEITLSSDNRTAVTIESGKFKGVIKGLPAEEFPQLKTRDGSPMQTLEADKLRNAIERVAFAASADEARPVLTAVRVMMDGGKVSLTATDGFRIAAETVDMGMELDRAIALVPATSLRDVSRLIGVTKASTVAFTIFDNSHIVFDIGNYRFIAQLIDGNYPDITPIIPKTHTTRVSLLAGNLLTSCAQAEIFAKEGTRLVKLYAVPGKDGAGGTLQLTASSEELGQTEIGIDCDVEGKELNIGFNVSFLREMLGLSGISNLAIEMTEANRPVRFLDEDNQDYFYVQMPMLIK